MPTALPLAAAELFLVRPHVGRGPWSLTILRRFLSAMAGIQLSNLVASKDVQTLLDRASGIGEAGGNARLKAIMRDFLESTMSLIEKHDISESEFWQAINYLQNGASEFGLIVPGVGIEHFLDLHMDATAAAAGRLGGTPRTIEGPLYVAGAPLVESGANLTDD